MNVEDIIGQKDLIGGGNIFRLQVIAFTATIFVLPYGYANNNNDGNKTSHIIFLWVISIISRFRLTLSVL